MQLQPIISFNYGAQNSVRVQKSLRSSLTVGTLFSIFLFVIIQLYSKEIVSLFNSDSKSFVAFTSSALRIVMLSLPLQGIINIGTNYFQYISQPRVSTILVILRQIIFQIPLAVFLPLIFNISGLWDSYYISDLLIFLLIIWLIKKRNQ